MSVDPVVLVQQARPGPSPDASSFTPQRGAMRRRRDTFVTDHDGNARSLAELATVPGSPTYREKIPNPPCGKCGADHNPIDTAKGNYDHPYIHPDQMENHAWTIIQPTGAAAPPPDTSVPDTAPGATTPATSNKRVTIMPARGEDDFIVGVETNPPEWDLEDSWRLSAEEVLRFLPILRLLGVKIRDNTGGDLKSLELERAGH